MHWTSPEVGPEGQIPLAVLWMGLQGLCVPVVTAQSSACHTALLQGPQSGSPRIPKKPAGPSGLILVLATPSRDKVSPETKMPNLETLLWPGKVSRNQEQPLDRETGRKEQGTRAS